LYLILFSVAFLLSFFNVVDDATDVVIVVFGSVVVVVVVVDLGVVVFVETVLVLLRFPPSFVILKSSR